MPDTLYLAFANLTGGCSCATSVITLTRKAIPPCEWYGEATICGSPTTVSFTCDTLPDIALTGGITGGTLNDPAPESCSPFLKTFAGVSLTCGGVAGTADLVIYE